MEYESLFDRPGHILCRRDSLRVGGLTALGLGLGNILKLRSASGGETALAGFGRAKSCILIWLDGGPSHLETFDPKPDSPAEVRGPLGSIATGLAGIRLGECLPNTAAIIHQLAIVRSMTSPLGEHNLGTHYLMTGYKPTPVLEYPTFGAVLSHVRQTPSVMPRHMAVPDFQVGGADLAGSGYLPPSTQPFAMGDDPAKPEFKVRGLDFYPGLDLARLERRREMLRSMNRMNSDYPQTDQTLQDTELDRAYDLILSADAKSAFRLSDEPANVRARYGGKSIGQSCLLARRLVERGVSFVTVNNTGWDTHEDLKTRLKDGYTGAQVGVGLIPSLDLALSALIADLQDRRMLDETLVVVMGEFGRTPKLNTAAGRDHWPRVFSSVLAGGGVQGGQVIGSSDSLGESPKDRPVTPSDLAATIYTLLGIDVTRESLTSDGRPVRVGAPDATVISELLS